jgi:hypothetical protein
MFFSGVDITNVKLEMGLALKIKEGRLAHTIILLPVTL